MGSFFLLLKTLLFIFTVAVVGNKIYLLPAQDDKALLGYLETFYIEGFDEDNNDSENEESDTFEYFNSEDPIQANVEQPNE